MFIFITIISYSVDIEAVFLGHGIRLPTYLHLIHRLGVQGAIPSLMHIPSQCAT